MFRLAYNTNGLAHHRLMDAFELVSELGYGGVAITPDVGELDPLRLRPEFVRDLRERALELDLALAIETGARFVLDPRRKHFPTLLEDDARDRARRVDFYRRSIDLAVDLGAPLVSIWSGAAPGGERGDPEASGERADSIWSRLTSGIATVLAHARARGVRLSFEPEPGMFIERPSGYRELVQRLGDGGAELGLTLDVGHLLVTRDLSVGRVIAEHARQLAHVHLDDSQPGIHEHRMFGTGELDLREVLQALQDARFEGLAAVELSRDSHRGAQAAREAMQHLKAVILNTTKPC